MTVQEAVRDITDILEEATAYEHAVCYVTSFDEEPLRMAIEAFGKQIPKDAVVLDKVYDEVRSCPACGKDTVYHGRTFFCCKCGQLLKWGE